MLRNLRRLRLRSSIFDGLQVTAAHTSIGVEFKQARRSYMQIARDYNKQNNKRGIASRSIPAMTTANDDDDDDDDVKGGSSSSSSSSSDSDSSSDEEELKETRKHRFLNESRTKEKSKSLDSAIMDEDEGNKKVSVTTNNAHKILRPKKEYYSLLKYVSQFNNDAFNTGSIYSIPSGGFVQLDQNDLKKVIPEGKYFSIYLCTLHIYLLPFF